MYRLPDEHLEAAKKIALENRKKKNCGFCYDRAYTGVNQDNFLILCHKCVDMEKAHEAWKEYVRGIPELKAEFPELFENEEQESAPEPDDAE